MEPVVIVVPPRLTANCCVAPRNTTGFAPFCPSSHSISSSGLVPAVVSNSSFAERTNEPTCVPRLVALTVYEATVAEAAASLESCGTAVTADDVPPEFAVDRLTRRHGTTTAVVVAVPDTRTRTTRIVLDADP